MPGLFIKRITAAGHAGGARGFHPMMMPGPGKGRQPFLRRCPYPAASFWELTALYFREPDAVKITAFPYYVQIPILPVRVSGKNRAAKTKNSHGVHITPRESVMIRRRYGS
jgi:hypothetical protein